MAKSWEDIAAYFEALGQKIEHPEFAGMAQLTRFIAASSLAPVLFGWTSMHDLCIQQTDGSPYSVPYLRISPQTSGVIEFRYIDTHIGRRQWHREVTPEQAIARLVKFIDQLRWLAAPVTLIADLRKQPQSRWLGALRFLRTLFAFKKYSS